MKVVDKQQGIPDMSILTDYKGFNAAANSSVLGWSQVQVVARLLGIDAQIDIEKISNRQGIEDAINQWKLQNA